MTSGMQKYKVQLSSSRAGTVPESVLTHDAACKHELKRQNQVLFLKTYSLTEVLANKN